MDAAHRAGFIMLDVDDGLDEDEDEDVDVDEDVDGAVDVGVGEDGAVVPGVCGDNKVLAVWNADRVVARPCPWRWEKMGGKMVGKMGGKTCGKMGRKWVEIWVAAGEQLPRFNCCSFVAPF